MGMVFVSIDEGRIHLEADGHTVRIYKPSATEALRFLKHLGQVSPAGLYSVSSSVDFPEDGGLPGFGLQAWLESGYTLAEERESARVS